MKLSTLYQNNIDKEFSRMIVASISFHIFIVCVFTLKVLFSPTETINYQSAMKVDLVALPDKHTESLPAPNISASKVEPLKTKPEPKVKNVKDQSKIDLKKKQKKAIEQLKALQSLEEEVKKTKEDEKKQKPVKGNILAAGTSLKGLNKLDYDTYIGDVDHQIKSNWTLPEWLARADLHARVRVLIDERGYVTKKEMLLSSKNSTYDSLVMDAIDRSSPFPAPPEKFKNLLAVDGIVFQFPD